MFGFSPSKPQYTVPIVPSVHTLVSLKSIVITVWLLTILEEAIFDYQSKCYSAQFNEEMEEETVKRGLNNAHVVDCFEAHSAHSFSEGLSIDTYTAIVNTMSEAATLAVYRALESEPMLHPKSTKYRRSHSQNKGKILITMWAHLIKIVIHCEWAHRCWQKNMPVLLNGPTIIFVMCFQYSWVGPLTY